MPDYNSSMPDYNSSAPDYNSSMPDYNSSAPDYNSSAQDYNSSIPDYNSSAPDYNSSMQVDYNSSIPDYNSPCQIITRPCQIITRPCQSKQTDYNSSVLPGPPYSEVSHVRARRSLVSNYCLSLRRVADTNHSLRLVVDHSLRTKSQTRPRHVGVEFHSRWYQFKGFTKREELVHIVYVHLRHFTSIHFIHFVQ